MEYVLENEQLRAVIRDFGAELKSLQDKASGQEYLWEADPQFWGKTSPVLFPFIGKLEGAGYRCRTGFYKIDKHGFARDMEFSVTAKTEASITLAISDTETTRQKFPFPFRLELTYTLTGNVLTVGWEVFNTGAETMPFSFGGHPAFSCPLKGADGSRTDCFIRLYAQDGKPVPRKALLSTDIGVPDGLLTGNSTELQTTDGFLAVTEHLFDQDALCLEKQDIRAVGLCDSERKEYIRLEADCPVWGIWSVPDSRAGYICLEPWWGICDSKDYRGSVEERPYTNIVKAGESFADSFRIAVSR